jgi:hypothetical protein
VLASSTPRNLPVVAEASKVGLQFYRVPGEMARAWVVHQARVAPGADAALEMLADPSFDPATTVVLEAGEVQAGLGGGRPDVGGESLAIGASANTVTLTATLAEPGWVVLADTHYPGWVAHVDGALAPLLHANYAFRAVAVEAGTHTVEFAYRPRSFAVGAWLSVVCLLVWLAAAVVSRWRAPVPADA